MVITFSILLFVMITGMLYFLGVKFWISPRTTVDRILEGGAGTDRPALHPSLAIHDILEKLGNLVPASPADLSSARQRLYNAGFRSPGAFKIFYGIKALATVALPMIIWLASMRLGVGSDNRMFLVVAAAGCGFILPNQALGLLIKRRKKKITRALPNALDLLIVCVESGLGLDQAIVQVSREMQKSYAELSSEFAITNLEMRHGKPRSEALKNLGERSGVEDMKRLCSTLVQADRFGTSISQTLRIHADFMRVTARQRAEEKAAKLAIKLVFPIFFCILPSLFVVTVGPVIFRIMNVLIPMMEGSQCSVQEINGQIAGSVVSWGMASPCKLSPSEQQQIRQWISAHGTPQQVALRCRIVLASSQGLSDVAIAKQLSVNRKTVILWRQRFAQQRLDGLWEIAPGRGRKPDYDIDKISAIVDATLQTKPKGMTHWSCRTLAKSQRVGKPTISSPIVSRPLSCRAIRSSWTN